MGNDAAAMEVDSKGGEGKRQEEAASGEEAKKPLAVIDLLCQSVFLLEEAVGTKETNLCMGRLLRQTAAARKRMSEGDIVKLIRKKLPKATDLEETLAPFLEVRTRAFVSHHAPSFPRSPSRLAPRPAFAKWGRPIGPLPSSPSLSCSDFFLFRATDRLTFRFFWLCVI